MTLKEHGLRDNGMAPLVDAGLVQPSRAQTPIMRISRAQTPVTRVHPQQNVGDEFALNMARTSVARTSQAQKPITHVFPQQDHGEEIAFDRARKSVARTSQAQRRITRAFPQQDQGEELALDRARTSIARQSRALTPTVQLHPQEHVDDMALNNARSFEDVLQSLWDMHESEVSQLHMKNTQLKRENDRLCLRVLELSRRSASRDVGAQRRGTTQNSWVPQMTTETNYTDYNVRTTKNAEDSNLEVLQLPGEVECLGKPGGGPKERPTSASSWFGAKERSEDELEFVGRAQDSDDLGSETSEEELDEALLAACARKRQLGMLLWSEAFGITTCFAAWSQLCRAERFVPRATWERSNPALANALKDNNNNSSLDAKLQTYPLISGSTPGERGMKELERTAEGSRYIISPGSNVRIVWDLVTTVLLAYDVIMVPLMAFDPPQDTFMLVMEWLSLILWTGDMAMSSITGFVARGVQVMDPRQILVNYLKTWFVLDVFTVVPDWVISFAGGDEEARQSKMLRAFRMVRVARLLRLAKLQRVLARLRDRIDSEVMFIMVNITKLLLLLLTVNHVLASVWYGIGALGMELSLPNWIEAQGFKDQSFGYRYTTSLHWSLTQFTPASMAVQPFNFWERTFAVICLVAGLVIFSSFISSITSAVTQLKNLSDDKAQQFWLLRRYLRQHNIDRELFFRILRYADYACRERNVMVTEGRLWVLGLLSEELRNEVQYHVSFSCLRYLPFFDEMKTTSNTTVNQLVNKALGQRCLASRDVLFSIGTPAAYVYIVVSGELQYIAGEDEDFQEVEQEDWLCEPAFWTPWIHVGVVSAKTESKVVSVEVASFMTVVTQEKTAHKLAFQYSRQYLRWLNRVQRNSLTDVSKRETMRPLTKKFLEQGRRCRATAYKPHK